MGTDHQEVLISFYIVSMLLTLILEGTCRVHIVSTSLRARLFLPILKYERSFLSLFVLPVCSSIQAFISLVEIGRNVPKRNATTGDPTEEAK